MFCTYIVSITPVSFPNNKNKKTKTKTKTKQRKKQFIGFSFKFLQFNYPKVYSVREKFGSVESLWSEITNPFLDSPKKTHPKFKHLMVVSPLLFKLHIKHLYCLKNKTERIRKFSPRAIMGSCLVLMTPLAESNLHPASKLPLPWISFVYFCKIGVAM